MAAWAASDSETFMASIAWAVMTTFVEKSRADRRHAYSVDMRLIYGSSVMALALMLTACSSGGLQSADEACGGGDAGITVFDDGSLQYDESADDTGDAWMCVLDTLVPDDADQFMITESLDDTVSEATLNGNLVVWLLHPDKGIQLGFDPQ